MGDRAWIGTSIAVGMLAFACGDASGGGGAGGAEAHFATLEEACQGSCDVADALASELSCDDKDITSCVADCEDSGSAFPACEDELITMLECTVDASSAQTCSCDENGEVSCNVCEAEAEAFLACTTAG